MANRLKPVFAGASICPSIASASSVSDLVVSLSYSHPKTLPYKLNAGLNNYKNRTNRRRVLGFGIACSWFNFMNMFGFQKGNSFLASARQKSAVDEITIMLNL
ncbi:60S ribosomal protein L5 [Bienertia sinuspersici]